MPRILSLLLIAAAIGASASAHAVTPPCGTTLTRSVTFDADMVCPPGVDGLVIGADNVAIDLNGFSMIGPNSGTTHGVLSLGFHGTRILGPGSILDFFSLVRIDGGDNHVILDVQALGFAFGIALYDTSNSWVKGNRVGAIELGSNTSQPVEANGIVASDATSIHLYGCGTYKNVVADNKIRPVVGFAAVSLDHGASGTQIINNLIVNGTILLAGSSQNLVSGNFIDNTVPSIIHAGVITASHVSMCAQSAPVDATNNLMRGNTLIGGPFGVDMAPGSLHNKVMDNKIYDQSTAGVRSASVRITTRRAATRIALLEAASTSWTRAKETSGRNRRCPDSSATGALMPPRRR